MARKSTATAKKIKPYAGRGLAIVGPYGNIWGKELFASKADAMRHLQMFWRDVDSFDISQWRVIQASAKVAPDAGATLDTLVG